MNQTYEAGKTLNITATNATLTQGGKLLGIFVAQASGSPTLAVADTNGTIAATFTPTAGQFYRLPAIWGGTLTVTIGGTVNATIFYLR